MGYNEKYYALSNAWGPLTKICLQQQYQFRIYTRRLSNGLGN
jgi:hypothetical protein